MPGHWPHLFEPEIIQVAKVEYTPHQSCLPHAHQKAEKEGTIPRYYSPQAHFPKYLLLARKPPHPSNDDATAESRTLVSQSLPRSPPLNTAPLGLRPSTHGLWGTFQAETTANANPDWLEQERFSDTLWARIFALTAALQLPALGLCPALRRCTVYRTPVLIQRLKRILRRFMNFFLPWFFLSFPDSER